ncbi:hypothetical protein ACJX0J_025223 [Zea mays]
MTKLVWVYINFEFDPLEKKTSRIISFAFQYLNQENGIVDLVTLVKMFQAYFIEEMTFASECYKLVVDIAILRISIWEVWKTGAFKSRLFLPIWEITPPSHDNHSASGLLLLQELLHNLRSRQNSWALTVGTTTCT